MKDLTDEQVLYHLKQDTLKRNKQLSVLIKLLNSMDDSTVMAIDGAWGSGKTVFIRQLLMLANGSVEGYNSSLDEAAIAKLQENQKVFYFNAWESDYIGDALSAILLKLIADDDEGLNAASIKRAAKIINISAGIKNMSHDFIDYGANTTKEKLVSDIRSIVDRHDAVNNFIDKLKGDKARVVFVVDELDRCKPSFAVDVLEVMKHYFVRDDVTFILAINTKELMHTVQKYYGQSFDGSSYLNKFFDYTYSLAAVDIENYARLVLNWSANGFVVQEVAHDAIRYFGLQMREINSYYSALHIIDNFLKRDRNWEALQWLVQLIFTPIALALKVKNDPRYDSFVNGKNADLLAEFLPTSRSALRYISGHVENKTNLEPDELRRQSILTLQKHYTDLFVREGSHISESLENFYDAISLMSDFTTITESEAK